MRICDEVTRPSTHVESDYAVGNGMASFLPCPHKIFFPQPSDFDFLLLPSRANPRTWLNFQEGPQGSHVNGGKGSASMARVDKRAGKSVLATGAINEIVSEQLKPRHCSDSLLVFVSRKNCDSQIGQEDR